jgi:hypothetical protein
MRHARLRVALGALLPLLAAAASAQPAPYVLTPRLGEEIDAAERAYFGLFPGDDSFVRARFAAERDSVITTVSYGGGSGEPARDTVWTLSRARAQALAAYVDGFEGLSSPFGYSQWQLLRGSGDQPLLDASVPTPHIGGGADVRVLVGQNEYEGVLLAASDSLLLLHPARQPYDWRTPAVLALDAEDVDWVTMLPRGDRPSRLLLRSALVVAGIALSLPLAVDQSFSVRHGGEGALIGGIVAGYTAGQTVADALAPASMDPGPYEPSLPGLRTRARFRFPADFPPGDAALRGRRSQAIAPEPASERGSMAWRLGEWRRAHGWVNVAVLGPGNWSGQYAEGPAFTETIFGSPTPLEQGVEHPEVAPSIGVDVALRPLPWVRAGVVWQHHVSGDAERSGGPALADNDEAAWTTPAALRGYAEAVIPTPRVGGFGLDLAVGVGLEKNEVAVERVANIGLRSIGYRYERSATGTLLQGTVELVTPRRSSFFFRYTRHPDLPSVDVPEEVIGEPGFPPLYTREAHTVDFGALREVTFGTRFRF